jgi:hypothetical protein
VSHLFQNQTHVSPADEVVWNVALGSTALGSTVRGSSGVLNSPSPSWTPALDEFVPKVDGKFKVRNPTKEWILGYDARSSCGDPAPLFLPRVVLKIIPALLTKDLDVFTRDSIKDEPASLNPCWWVKWWWSGGNGR